MQISSKLFNQQSIRNFEKLNEGIQTTQEKISTGQNILSASDDPVAAVNLSVAKEQRDLLSRFQANSESAKSRLDLSDEIFDQSIVTLTRITELTIQAGNGTGDTTPILQEIDALKEVMIEMANTRDSQGQALFSGFRTNSVPFEIQVDGSVAYKGDRGQHSVQLSESMKVKTSIDGGSAFMRIKTADGTHGLFDIIDNSFNSVQTSNNYKRQASANAHAEVTFTLPPNPQKWTFNLKGSQGVTSISAELANGKLDDTLIPVINALTDKTGIPDISETVKRSPVKSSVIENNCPCVPCTSKTVDPAVVPSTYSGVLLGLTTDSPSPIDTDFATFSLPSAVTAIAP